MCVFVCVSAFVHRLLRVDQTDVCEGEVAFLALALAFPLAIHVDLRYCHNVTHLQTHTHTVSQLLNGVHVNIVVEY